MDQLSWGRLKTVQSQLKTTQFLRIFYSVFKVFFTVFFTESCCKKKQTCLKISAEALKFIYIYDSDESSESSESSNSVEDSRVEAKATTTRRNGSVPSERVAIPSLSTSAS